MIPLLLTALLLTLAHCHEPLLEPTDELQPMDVKMGYEDVVMNEQTDLDQEVESQTVEEERQFISARVVCPSGCCTEGSKCEKLGGECYPQSSTQRCHHASLAPDLCGTSRCRCCINAAAAVQQQPRVGLVVRTLDIVSGMFSISLIQATIPAVHHVRKTSAVVSADVAQHHRAVNTMDTAREKMYNVGQDTHHSHVGVLMRVPVTAVFQTRQLRPNLSSVLHLPPRTYSNQLEFN
ncbi:hypothetical protein Pcinc_009913 [Petrolisthes cinctipes]|uniref:Uncharacterized protein n=1 Tax=Petrolisthes cinctipes TaxID=88211 RepID=A0AAE1KXY0_PETCI|nr:hypothetical protein Pcinc_009913 [Petrolisthes cinctipes]